MYDLAWYGMGLEAVLVGISYSQLCDVNKTG